jgi:thiamine pyrophosphokinase
MTTERRRALIVADGETPARAALDATWPGWDDDVALVVAADGGARGAEALGLQIDLLVGDGDSLGAADTARLTAAGIEVRTAPTAKDESDTELAVLAAIERGATEIVILGAFGGSRFDHALANVVLLALPALDGRPCILLDARTRVALLTGPASLELSGRAGDLVSLLPLGDGVAGVATSGLAYPLAEEPLPLGPARGLSNVRTGPVATVSVTAGRLLVVESPSRSPSPSSSGDATPARLIP